MLRRRLIRRLVTATAVVALVGSLAACDQIPGFPSNPTTPTPTITTSAPEVTPTATCGDYVFDSVFSAFGSVHSSVLLANKLTLYLDMFTEQKTHEWYPTSTKNLSFVLRVVDSSVPVRAKFKYKREVYMGDIQIDAQTKNAAGENRGVVYEISGDPRKFTLDPEATAKEPYGLLITSPKGGFQLNSVKLKPMHTDVIGFNMNFSFQLSVERRVNSNRFNTKIYSTVLPVAVFTPATAVQSSSCATNATLKPEDAR